MSRQHIIRVGFLGGRFNLTHAQCLKKLGGVQIVATCTRHMESAREIAAECSPDTRPFDDFDRMLAEAPMDALYVALPPFAHDGEIERAAEKGIHLFLEKPIALTLDRARSQVAAIEKAAIVSQVGYQMRFAEPVRRLKAMLDDGTAGRPTLFDGAYLCNALHSGWWRDVTRSGGQVVEQIIHQYDLAMHLLGRPTSVSAQAANLCHQDVDGYTIEDTSAAVIGFENGAMAAMVGSNCAVPMQWRSEFRLICRNLTAHVRELGDATFTFSNGQPSEHFWKTRTQPESEAINVNTDPYLDENEHFIACLRRQEPTLTPARQGLESLRLVLAVADSARAGGARIALDGSNVG